MAHRSSSPNIIVTTDSITLHLHFETNEFKLAYLMTFSYGVAVCIFMARQCGVSYGVLLVSNDRDYPCRFSFPILGIDQRCLGR